MKHPDLWREVFISALAGAAMNLHPISWPTEEQRVEALHDKARTIIRNAQTLADEAVKQIAEDVQDS